jgi:hypothetical protein
MAFMEITVSPTMRWLEHHEIMEGLGLIENRCAGTELRARDLTGAEQDSGVRGFLESVAVLDEEPA